MKKITAHSFRFLLSGLFFMLMCTSSFVYSQTLTISSTGEIGTSGINWNTSGTNPVTITASGGTANVNTSVILSYLNNGISVIVQNNNSNGSVGLVSDLTKSAGGDATLSLRGNLQAYVSAPIKSTSSKMNVILWSDYNNSNVGGVALSAAAMINTNGGHFWAGGSSTAAGSFTWNGLTVGNGPSVGSSGANHYAMDLFTSQINTNGGDILLWSGTGNGSALDGIGMQNNPHLNAGSGNVTLITRQIFNANNTLSVTTTGKLALATDASNPWTSDFNWATTTSGSNVTLTSALGQPLQINNFSSLGGLFLGVYGGFGTSFNYTNFQNVNINSSINIPGPINVYGGNIFAQQNLTSTLSGAPILLQATGYISVSGTIQANDGDITLRSNAGGTAVVLPNSTTGAITLNSGSSLLSNGGNITLGGNFDGTKGTGLYATSGRTGGSPGVLINNATLNAGGDNSGGNINIYGRCSTSYNDGIRLQANISTTGAGSIGLYGDAFGGFLSGTNVWFGGLTFITNSSTIETENGNINIEGVLTNTQSNGTYALNFYRSAYTSGDATRNIQIISKAGDIQITGDRGGKNGQIDHHFPV